ncbi:MAG: adenine glycosylase, partial [Atopobiaceae bacterium]|nr:adenine glycosylase [Atopobiaceae bacterium]
MDLEDFRALVLSRGRDLYRDLPWRRTRDPYAIWISEVMLQQTQVARVDGRWQRWLERFPTPDALAAADTADVLAEWQGLGYNRRALSLADAARKVSAAGGGMP